MTALPDPSVTIEDLAEEARECFVPHKTRPGTYVRTDDCPQWVENLVFDAHEEESGDHMLPDDWRYRFIVDALDIIVDQCVRDFDDDFIIEPDYENHVLIQWLGSHGYRPGYCDTVYEVAPKNTMELIAAGQMVEREEVFVSVLRSLQRRLEELL